MKNLIISILSISMFSSLFAQEYSFSENSKLKENYYEDVPPLINKTTSHYVYYQNDADSVVRNVKSDNVQNKFSFLLKGGVNANLTFFNEAPLFYDAGIRFQYKMGIYEIGIGPGILYCPGNDMFMNMIVGNLSISNNFYIIEKEETSTFLFAEIGKESYWNNLETEYSEQSLLYGNAILDVGLGVRFGNKKKGHFEVGYRALFWDFFAELEHSFAHFGIGYAF